MSQPEIVINPSSPQFIEFQMDVEGIDSSKSLVRFVILTKPMSLSFDCKQENGNKYVVEIPTLAFLHKDSYDFKIEAIIDGYFFTPTTGTVRVIQSPKVTIEDNKAENTKESEDSAPTEEDKHDTSEDTVEEVPEAINFTPIVLNPLSDEKKKELKEAIERIAAEYKNSKTSIEDKDKKVREIIASVTGEKGLDPSQ